MIKLPFGRIPLQKWKVYRAPLPTNEKEHRIIIITVINDMLQYFYVTSKVESARIRTKNDKGSLAEIKPDEWDILTTNSCVQCGKAYLKEVKIDYLRQLYNDDKLIFLGDLPENIKTRIIAAICSSDTYTDAQKKAYTS